MRRHENHYGLLLLTLAGFLAVFPFLSFALGRNRWIVADALFTLVLLGAVYVASRERRSVFVASLLLAVPVVVLNGVSYLVDSRGLDALRDGLAALLLLAVGAAILLDVQRSKRVSADALRGALCVYLLMGVAWSSLYSLVETVWPGSFSIPEMADLASRVPEAVRERHGFLYYSFVTLTTLGYGDTTPLTPPARTLSWTEALAGQVYLVVTVARLVGVHVAQAAETRRD